MSEMEIQIYTDLMVKYEGLIPDDIRNMEYKDLTLKAMPNYKLYSIKRSFWKEHDRCRKLGRTMSPLKVFDGILGRDAFNRILANPYKMQWLITPIANYESQMKGIIDKAMERYDDLLNMEITISKQVKNKETGEYETETQTCARKATVLLATLNSIQDRVKGTAIQRQVNISTVNPVEAKAEVNMVAVDDRLKELEERLGNDIVTVDISEGKDEA